jgi:transcriptional regulator with XRE-family HTH domain
MRKEIAITMERSAGVRLRPFTVPTVRPSELARAAGVSHQYVSAVLAGRRPPSRKLLEAARELGVPVDALFGDATTH